MDFKNLPRPQKIIFYIEDYTWHDLRHEGLPKPAEPVFGCSALTKDAALTGKEGL